MLLAAVRQKEIDERITVDDAQVVAIVDRLIRQRRDSIEQFEKAARQDLADREKLEIEVLSAYLPQQASRCRGRRRDRRGDRCHAAPPARSRWAR